MGFRVHFPDGDYNSWARIQPPFEIPAFEPKATIDDQGGITPAAANAQGTDPVNARLTRFEGSYDPNTKITTALGIVKNVGVLKSVAGSRQGARISPMACRSSSRTPMATIRPFSWAI